MSAQSLSKSVQQAVRIRMYAARRTGSSNSVLGKAAGWPFGSPAVRLLAASAFLLLSLAAPARAVPVSDTLSITDFGATGTDTSDDTQAVRQAVARLEAAGGGVLRVPAGTYYLSDEVVVDEAAVSIYGEGIDRSIFEQTALRKSGIVLRGVRGTTVRDVQVRGVTYPGPGERWGFVLEGCKNVSLIRVKAVDCDDAGIRVGYLASGDVVEESEDCFVYRAVVEDTKGGSGIEIMRAEGTDVYASRVVRSRQHGIRLVGALRTYCAGNTTKANKNGFKVQAYGDGEKVTKRASDVLLKENTSERDGMGIRIAGNTSEVTIRENRILQPRQYGVFVELHRRPGHPDGSPAHALLIEGNFIRGGSRGIAVRGHHYDIDILRNEVVNLSSTGRAYGVSIDGAGTKRGIYDTRIKGNRIRASQGRVQDVRVHDNPPASSWTIQIEENRVVGPDVPDSERNDG
jgi:hypothetical protein